VIDDKGFKYGYMKERFIPIDIVREDKLKIILDEKSI